MTEGSRPSTDPTVQQRAGLAARLRVAQADGRLDLPPLGGGDTTGRWRALVDLARADVALGRIAEAHVDAVAILAEAGRSLAPGRLAGVWASERAGATVTGEPVAAGWRLGGRKAFSTGVGLIDEALVTVEAEGRHLLVLVAVDDLPDSRIDLSGWRTTALAETRTATVDLTGTIVDRDAVIGGDNWYLDRPGFWDGAIGPAACWAGAAAALVDHATAHRSADPHGRAHLGAMTAGVWAMEAALERAGREIDAAVASGSADAVAGRRRALVVRHLVDVTSAEVQDRFSRALGPRPLVGDAEVAAVDAALRLYRRQCHAERDLEALSDLLP